MSQWGEGGEEEEEEEEEDQIKPEQYQEVFAL